MGSMLSRGGPPSTVVLKLAGTPSDGDSAGLTTAMEASRACATELAAFEKGNKPAIGKALSSPKNEALKKAAMESLVPNMRRVETFRVNASKIATAVANTLAAMAAVDADAEAGGVARLLAAAISFDYNKLVEPSIVNDFSFYRKHAATVSGAVELPVRPDDCDEVLVFLSDQTPMLTAVERKIAAQAADKRATAVQHLAGITNACCGMVMRKEEELEAAKAMTAAFILFDRLDATGAFVSSSPIATGKCVQALHGLGPEAKFLKKQMLHNSRTSEYASQKVKSLLGAR